MVELRTKKRELRGNGENHHEKLGLQKILCVSELTIPEEVGISSDPPGNIIGARSSQPNQASRSSDFLYLLVSFRLFPS
jgi:hypothetical protein